MLNEMQKDVLLEQMNIYIGQAAALLSEMIDHRIDLSVPELNIMEVDIDNYICQAFPSFIGSDAVSSSIRFGDEFSGKAYLVFPTIEAKKLINLFTGDVFPDVNVKTVQLVENDLDVMTELGNVILNAIIGGMSNFLGTMVEYSMPEIEMLDLSETEPSKDSTAKMYIMLIRTAFNVSDQNISGYIMVIMSMDSIELLVGKLEEYIKCF